MLPYYLAYGTYKYVKLRFFNDSKPFGCSLAPTVKCNLKCKHCYESRNRMSKKKELSIEAIDNLAERLSKQGMKHCTLTDGEPLITNESIEKCEVVIKHFWMNYIVTNGTMEIPDFPVIYILSLDGPPKIHDKLRGSGVFGKLKKNVRKSPNDNIYALCTLNTTNHKHIPNIIVTAMDLGLKGIMFNWYNPSSANDPLWIDYPTRNKDIDRLINLLDHYPKFIYNTIYELNLLRTPKWTGSCPNHWIPSYDAFGNLKIPCIFGEHAYCSRCGCHVFPALSESITKGRETVQMKLALDFADTFWIKDNIVKNVITNDLVKTLMNYGL